jgi:hypothetical protein
MVGKNITNKNRIITFIYGSDSSVLNALKQSAEAVLT